MIFDAILQYYFLDVCYDFWQQVIEENRNIYR